MKPPLSDQIEVSVFGPLRGFGESIALHIGNGQWVIIDSCYSNKDKKPAPLSYLESIGVDVSESVRMVVASHWHSDHINGLGEIFRECTNAEFVCSSALQSRELLEISQAYNRNSLSTSKHGLEEFHKIICTLLARSPNARYKHFSPPVFAINRRTLLQCKISKDVECVITALSPSDASVLAAQIELGSILNDYIINNEPKRNIIDKNPNHNAIAMWIKIGGNNILLGSDLEETKNPYRGWSAIFSWFDPQDDKADIYKVSHHGSSTGENSLIWENLLGKNPHALLTSFVNGGNQLPKNSDVTRIKKKTKHCYITSAPHLTHRKFSRDVKSLVQNATRNFHSIDNTIGQICARTSINNDSGSSGWHILLDGHSRQL